MNSKVMLLFIIMKASVVQIHAQTITVNDISVANNPGNDQTNSISAVSLRNRGQGGNMHSWSIYTSAIGGGFGVRPNAFEIWEYPASSTNCCNQRISVSPTIGNQPFKSLIISSIGNMGIGRDPENDFSIDVIGNIRNSGNVAIGSTSVDNVQGWNKVLDLSGIGNAKLLVRSNNVKTGIFSHDTWPGSIGRIGTETNHELRLMVGYGNDVMSLFPNGNVGIGTTNTGSYKLAVEGTIGARKLKVTQTTWADDVFKPAYKLKSLKEVEHFILKNKHLPGVPSEKQVMGNDIDVADTQALLLKKIEELTLYVIELKKENVIQSEAILKMSNIIKTLKK